jgi:hypothetical protein
MTAPPAGTALAPNRRRHPAASFQGEMIWSVIEMETIVTSRLREWDASGPSFPRRSAAPQARSRASCARYGDALQTRDRNRLRVRDDPASAVHHCVLHRVRETPCVRPPPLPQRQPHRAARFSAKEARPSAASAERRLSAWDSIRRLASASPILVQADCSASALVSATACGPFCRI